MQPSSDRAALADVLCGDYNPSGRLPITFPKSVGQIPFNFPAHPGSQGRDGGQDHGPLYPFGHGLSYTTFKYGSVSVSPERATAGATFVVGCDVTNTGARAGEEVVQLYLRDEYTSVVTFDQQLRGFTRVRLAPGETKRLQFEVKPEGYVRTVHAAALLKRASVVETTTADTKREPQPRYR